MKTLGFKLSTFFEYDEQVRKTNYSTNPIEGMYRQVRKIIKSKTTFSFEHTSYEIDVPHHKE